MLRTINSVFDPVCTRKMFDKNKYIELRRWLLYYEVIWDESIEVRIRFLSLYAISKVQSLWHLIFALFGVQWVMHSTIRGVLLSWCGISVGKKRKKAWKAAPLCLFWTILREINRRAFDNCESMGHLIGNSFLYLL